ncbi:hypothetical protein GCM10020331_049690 [Ectobacillus funiculus]
MLLRLQKHSKKQRATKNRPTLIEVRTIIGFGSPNKSGKSASHGSPLGKSETQLTKRSLWLEFRTRIPRA